jgi:hypothetical protein
MTTTVANQLPPKQFGKRQIDAKAQSKGCAKEAGTETSTLTVSAAPGKRNLLSIAQVTQAATK